MRKKGKENLRMGREEWRTFKHVEFALRIVRGADQNC
jgi:hypothetical protein